MMARQRIVVIGAGGFAREVKWLIEEIGHAGGPVEFAGYVVSDLSRLGEHDSRGEVQGDLDWLRENRGRFDALAIGIGTPAHRLKISSELLPDFPEDLWPALVHPNVRMDRGTSTIGAGALLCAGTVGTVHLALEPFCLVNLACTLGHEARIGRGSVLNPTVNISGGVVLEEGVLVGTGAQVLQYLTVGKGATVGAGAVVTKDVAPGTTMVGMPAKPLAPRQP
jgi:sugar O-acyltransferase (sialic acid O-acetyltransferase NeuD family)